MTGCAVCGKPPGELGVRLDVQFHPGQIGPRAFAEVPYRMRDIESDWDCLQKNPLLMAVLTGGDLEPVISMRGHGCRVECSGYQRGPVRRFWSPLQGVRGVPEVGRCPVCWGPIEIPEVA